MNKLFKFTWLAAAALMTIFTACEKDDLNVTEDTDFFVNSSVYDMEERANCGRFGCFDFVFPLTVEFPDGDTSDVEDYDGLRATISTWKEANPDAEERPTFTFPIEVMDEDGTITSIASSEELRELVKQCRRDFFQRKRHRRGKYRGGKCFKPVFPLSLTLPNDGGTITGEDARDLKSQVREWKAANPDADERPTLVFPIQVEDKDGNIIDVADLDALKALKEECAADESDG